MIDIKLVRENLVDAKKSMAKRSVKIDFDNLLKLDEAVRDLKRRIEELRAKQNQLASQREKSDKAIEIKRMLKDLEPQLREAEENYKVEAVKVPNILLEDVPTGKDENDNIVLRKVNEIKLKSGKDHVKLGTALNIIDIDRAVKVSGNRFYYLKNKAVELEFALIKYATDIIKAENFTPILPPILIKEEIAWGSGHNEAMSDDAYHMKSDPLVAVGTSEQSILAMHAGETLKDLPERYLGFSTCLRREAGSYGKDTRGILRSHQFDKLEMFSFCEPKDSQKEHELIISLEEKIMQGLKLPYQIVALCGGDISAPSAKTIDIETWLPGQEKYRETHSSSNCTDFQARRLNIRYKNDKDSGFVHTLNGTAIAIGRILIAIIENYQTPDGSIKVPEVLQKYVDFKEIKN